MERRLLSVEGLRVQFRTYAGLLRAVNEATFDVRHREVFGLVGETGCGKTVTGLSILRLVPPPGEIVAGKIAFDGLEILSLNEAEMREIRGGRIAMIFQNPAASLNPVFSVGEQISRVIRLHRPVTASQAHERTLEILEAVGLPDAPQMARAYPHELSGGMQQRVMIAMALSSDADLLIADEPTTALDVTIQAQILDLLAELREERGLSILLITHNLGVVAETCDRVAVLYVGHVVEEGPTREIFKAMKHPYTKGLLAAIPRPGSQGQALPAIPGSVPSALDLLPGCPFQPRCSSAIELCQEEPPARVPVGPEHYVACHLYREAER